MTTSGQGQNSHNIQFLSQGDINCSIKYPNQGWQMVIIFNFCHKVVVTKSDINCNYALPAFCGPIARPAREYDLFHAQIYILIAWSTAFVPRPWALLCRRSAWNRNAWPAWRIKSREGIVIRPFEGYIFLDMPGAYHMGRAFQSLWNRRQFWDSI